MQKFDVILDQYMKEILAVDDNFTVSTYLTQVFKYFDNLLVKVTLYVRAMFDDFIDNNFTSNKLMKKYI